MKRGAAEGLRKAARYYRQRRFGMVINFLEPQVFLYRESERYYYLLGMSCMMTGDYAGAYSFLSRAVDIEPTPDALLALGATLLRRRQTDRAIKTYLDVLDIDPSHRRARRALQWLRTIDDPEEALEWFEDRRIRAVLPPLGWYVPRGARIVMAVALAAGLGFAGWQLLPPLLDRWTGEPPRAGVELVQLDRSDARLSGETTGVRYLLTDTEVTSVFRTIERAFLDGRDDVVAREINRISLSNAAPALRERAELLRDYLIPPDFTTYPGDGPTFAEVAAEPSLYDGVHVRWQGRAANVRVDPDAVRFDLLVGYVDREVLEGVVPVTVPFAVIVSVDLAVEVIGRVETGVEGGPALGLEVVSFRPLPATVQ